MHYTTDNNLEQATYRLPRWMLANIEKIRRKNCYQSKTEAARRVMIAGFRAMGYQPPEEIVEDEQGALA